MTTCGIDCGFSVPARKRCYLISRTSSLTWREPGLPGDQSSAPFRPPHPTPHTLSVATGSRSPRAHASATSQDAPVFLSEWLAEAQLPQRCPGSPTREPPLAHPAATAITRKQAGFLGLNTDQHHPTAPVFRDPHSPGTYHTL